MSKILFELVLLLLLPRCLQRKSNQDVYQKQKPFQTCFPPLNGSKERKIKSNRRGEKSQLRRNKRGEDKFILPTATKPTTTYLGIEKFSAADSITADRSSDANKSCLVNFPRFSEAFLTPTRRDSNRIRGANNEPRSTNTK